MFNSLHAYLNKKLEYRDVVFLVSKLLTCMMNLQYDIKICQKIYYRVTSTENVWYEIDCITVGNSVCIPFIIPIGAGPGFLQAFFLQISPIGQSISLLH